MEEIRCTIPELAVPPYGLGLSRPRVEFDITNPRIDVNIDLAILGSMPLVTLTYMSDGNTLQTQTRRDR
jgi:hypothetical protein